MTLREKIGRGNTRLSCYQNSTYSIKYEVFEIETKLSHIGEESKLKGFIEDKILIGNQGIISVPGIAGYK
jgi:hypothetical protein